MRRLEWLAVGLALAVAPAAAQQKIVCLQTISVTEAPQTIPQGWRVDHSGLPRRLFTVGMAYADGFDIRADYEKKLSGDRTKYTWDLNAVVKKEPWFVRCEYEQTDILLLIPVQATMKFCSTIQKSGFDRKIQNFTTCE